MDRYIFIKAEMSHDEANPCMAISREDENIRFLQRGTYMLVVDFRWNYIASQNSCLKKINVAVTSPELFTLENLSMPKGFKALSKAFIDHSQNYTQKDKRNFFSSQNNYAYRMMELKPCRNSWLSYFVIQNG